MKIFITGIRSCLGTHLSEKFLELGHQVAGISGMDQACALFDQKELGLKVSLTIGDILEKHLLSEAIHFFLPDVIIHLELVEFKNGISLEELFARNVQATVAILDVFKNLDGRRSLLCLSTDHVLSYLRVEHEIDEAEVPFGLDPYSASMAARESAVQAVLNFMLPPQKYKQHGKALGILRMSSIQCWECDIEHEGLWSEIRRAQKYNEVPVLKNMGAYRQWYPQPEATEHIVKLTEEIAKQGAFLGGVWHMASLTIPSMTVGEYVASLDPQWALALNKLPDFRKVRSRHPILSVNRLKELMSLRSSDKNN